MKKHNYYIYYLHLICMIVTKSKLIYLCKKNIFVYFGIVIVKVKRLTN